MVRVFLISLGSGVLGTLSHQTQLSSYPIGLALSFAVVSIGALRARKENLSRIMFPLVFGLLIFLFAQDFTRDKLIPANSLGIIWSYGSVALATLVSLWPKNKVQR